MNVWRRQEITQLELNVKVKFLNSLHRWAVVCLCLVLRQLKTHNHNNHRWNQNCTLKSKSTQSARDTDTEKWKEETGETPTRPEAGAETHTDSISLSLEHNCEFMRTSQPLLLSGVPAIQVQVFNHHHHHHSNHNHTHTQQQEQQCQLKWLVVKEGSDVLVPPQLGCHFLSRQIQPHQSLAWAPLVRLSVWSCPSCSLWPSNSMVKAQIQLATGLERKSELEGKRLFDGKRIRPTGRIWREN